MVALASLDKSIGSRRPSPWWCPHSFQQQPCDWTPSWSFQQKSNGDQGYGIFSHQMKPYKYLDLILRVGWWMMQKDQPWQQWGDQLAHAHRIPSKARRYHWWTRNQSRSFGQFTHFEKSVQCVYSPISQVLFLVMTGSAAAKECRLTDWFQIPT